MGGELGGDSSIQSVVMTEQRISDLAKNNDNVRRQMRDLVKSLELNVQAVTKYVRKRLEIQQEFIADQTSQFKQLDN